MEAGEPRVYEVEPHADGLTVVPSGELDPETIAAAVRHTLSLPEPRTGGAIPFVRVALESEGLAIEAADDASQSMRMLTEGRPGALPLVMEAVELDDVEALISRISRAAGMEPERFALGLSTIETAGGGEASAEESAYVEAQRRATHLAKAVREIDDRMTASVVPDWLWVATGFGGLGVLLTAIVFLYPETRIFLIPALIVLSLIGFLLYGWRSMHELRLRGRLQIERAEMRARREEAREAAKQQRAALVERGSDPDAVLVRWSEMMVPKDVPAVLARDVDSLAELERIDRRAIVFVAGASAHPRVRALTRKSS
jgi:hypothetical protein